MSKARNLLVGLKLAAITLLVVGPSMTWAQVPSQWQGYFDESIGLDWLDWFVALFIQLMP